MVSNEQHNAWYKIVIPDLNGPDQNVVIDFTEEFARFRTPFKMAAHIALFLKIDTAGNRLEYYVTPLAARYLTKFIEKYSAEPCDPPKASDVTFWAGSIDARELLR